MDALTRLPIPPVDMQVTALNQTSNAWLAGISIAMLLLALLFGVKDLRQTRSPMFIFLLIGGALDGLVEPIVDIVGGCWHPVIGQQTLFEIMGRPMPYWLPLVYAAFYGILAAVVYRCVRDGMSRRAMWTLFLICLTLEPIAEGGMLHWDTYTYYGNQPLWIAALPPLWWIPANIAAISATGIAAIFAERSLGAAKASLLMLMGSPLIDAGMTSFVGFPAMVAVNSPFPNWLTQLCGVASVAIGLYALALMVRLMAKDSPERITTFKTAPAY